MTFCRLEIPATAVFALSTHVAVTASETVPANPGILLKSSMLRGVALTVTSYLYRKSFRFHTATVTVVLTLTSGGAPRVGNMLCVDYLRPAAIKAGVELEKGQRFGFHNLRP